MAQKVLARRPELRDFEVFRESDTGLTSRQVLEQHIEWRPFVDGKFMDEKDLGLLRDYQQPDDQAILLQERGGDLAKLFIKLMLNVSQEPVQQYILALVDQLLSEDESRRSYFHSLPREYNPFKPFLSILNLSANHTYHPFTIAKTTRVLAVLLNAGVSPDSAELREFLQYLITRMDSAKGAELISAVSASKILLRNHEVQGVFIREGGLKPLVNLLRKDTQNTQLVYIAAFTLWLFTFNQDIVAELHDNGVVAKLSDVLKNVVKEKVVRVTLAALRNLLDKQGLNEQMISHGVHKTVPSLMQRKWNDDDLESDLKVVDEKLQGAIQGLSSFERYKAEIESGVVEWTPVHNEKFWRENVTKFDEHNGQLVKSLVNLLDGEDEVTLEVACFDLGEFARWHPEGKKIVAKLGGKTKLMKHMMSKFPKVSKQALLAVQKIMVQNWESLNTASSASAGGAPTL